ncbi:MAG TPA: TRAP transporter permease, partial [Negativicutes bacterium]|nr:TRAP transporter permease [Negativicutes bacterium]
MSDEKEKKVISADNIEQDFSQEDLEALMKKVDKESTFRKLKGYQYQFVFWLAVAWSGFQLYTALFGLLAAHLQRSIH